MQLDEEQIYKYNKAESLPTQIHLDLINTKLTFRPPSKNTFLQGCNTSSRRKGFRTNIRSISQSKLDLQLIFDIGHLKKPYKLENLDSPQDLYLGLLFNFIQKPQSGLL